MLPQQKPDFVANLIPPTGFHSRSKRAVGYFVFFTVILAALMALLIVFLDPLQFYHRSNWYTPVFSTQERYQNPGLAKNYDYDTIIIGTSMTENFLPSEVDKSLGGKTLKLSIEGSTVEEHYKIARLALKSGKVKKVLWGLDYFSLKDVAEEDKQSFPDYLYDDKWWNDYKYWYNSSVYTQFAVSLKKMYLGQDNDLEHLNNWNDESVFSKARVVKSYNDQSASEAYFSLNEEDTPQLQKRFNTYINQLLIDYPDVQFYFYYPPYSIMRQLAWYNTNPKRYNNQLEMRKWMFQQFEQHSNSRLYDFQSEAQWTFNLDLYKDISHHNEQVNSWIAQAIGRDDSKYRVSADNIDPLNNTLISQTTSATMDKLGNVYAYDIQINAKSFPFTSRVTQGDGELFVTATEAALALGATLTWDSVSKTAILTNKHQKLEMTVGNNKGKVNGQEVPMTNPLLLTAGRTMVPMQFVADQLGWKTTVHIAGAEYLLTIDSP